MVAPFPETDPRGVKELRRALEREAAALVPELSQSTSGGFGQAFYQLAVRMAAQLTTRLNQTAKRDAIAFFDALDIPAPPPRSAEAPLVFTLAEKRDAPVAVPQGVQVGADAAGGAEVIFETTSALTLTPAHLTQLLAVDADSDCIERAPANVVLPAPAPGPFPRYELATFADRGSKVIQVTPSTGLAKDDFIRIGEKGSVYRIEKIEQELCTLAPALEAAAVERTVIEKVIRFDAFALRDVQAHQVFIAHDELLNLKALAFITVAIGPASVVSRLNEMDIGLFVWDTRTKETGDKDTDWHELTLTGPVKDGLKFHKSWQGEVEKLELAGQKSRWLKLVLRDKISNRAGIGARINTLGLLIESDPSVPATNERTVTRAFSNNTPLPLTSNFFPFGPEPLRFDTFSLAAPEALSKKGAMVTLDVKLVDATLVALTLVHREGTRRAYGIGVNGRAQALTFGAVGEVSWRELASPILSGAGAVPSGAPNDAAFRLTSQRPIQAIALESTSPLNVDCIVVHDTEARLWAQNISYAKENIVTANGWRLLPPPANAPDVRDLVLMRSGVPSDIAFALIVVRDKTGLQVLSIAQDGSIKGTWAPLTSASLSMPKFAGDAVLVSAYSPSDSNPAPQIALIDGAGLLWRGQIDAVRRNINWQQLRITKFKSSIRPAALAIGETFLVAAKQEDPKNLVIVAKKGNESPTQVELFADGFVAFDDTPLAIHVSSTQSITVAATGTKDSKSHAAVWIDPARPLLIPVLDDGAAPPNLGTEANSEAVSGAPQSAAVVRCLLVPEQASGLPSLAVTYPQERIWWAKLISELKRVDVVGFYHALPLAISKPRSKRIDLGRDGEAGFACRLSKKITHEAIDYYGAPGSIALPKGTKCRVLQIKKFGLTGVVQSSNQIKLASSAQDPATKKGSVLIVKDRTYEVIEDVDNHLRIAKLKQNLPVSSGSIVYRTTDQIVEQEATGDELGRMVELAQATAGTSLSVQLDGMFVAKTIVERSGPLLLLATGWDRVPAAKEAYIDVSGSFSATEGLFSKLDRGYQNPELSWEYFDGHGWGRLLVKDGTQNLAAGGLITFKVPADLDQTDVAGQTDYWIRARLIGGDYGHAKYIVETAGKDPSTQTIRVDTSDLHPPEILSITATFKLSDPAPAQIVLADNNGGMLDQTQTAAEKNAEFELFEGLLALDRFGAEEPLAGRELFLGFAKPFNVSSLSLYVDAEEQDGEGSLQAAVLAQGGWRNAFTDDETVGLRRRGFIRISALEQPVRAALFGQELYWLRLGLKSPDAAAATDWQPKVSGLYVNAVRVDQARSVTREMLGSSDGSPDQTYTLSGKPVLLHDGPGRSSTDRDGDPDIELRVREQLSDEDRALLATTIKGAEAVVKPSDLPGDWVLWRRVDSLLGAGRDDRVFTLDADKGVVHFGDNRSGKIPPAGRDGICVFRYRQGGGLQGNVPAFAIKNLKTALESVDAAVNPIEAAGGLDAPNIERIIASAPALLRHANRAVSAADMEAFAVASSPDVARARLVMPREPGDAMQLAVAIRTKDAQPRPSRARAEALAKHILEHASGGINADALKVVPPDYVPLMVRVDLLATSADAVAGVDSAVRERLARFLHPTDGGPDGDGWPFARRAWPSDIDRVLTGIPGIDRVTNIELNAKRDLDDLPPTAMICMEHIKVEVTTGGPT
ncbi:hypothetical protein JQ636_12510 [Bradyrhizobium japonicum]|uniref:hypothetical protein n=1 Tax=Bradyrhizobium japonicum TaxID=375 RepID=UPI001BAA4C10|nr:hypothetical protein [Bradyrhizobium japonicum]MBR0804363.1 hypothetical protein [Bradyrhizobium japonicum]